MTKEPTVEEKLDYLRGLYIGAHSQADAVHGDYENEDCELECKFKWCWPTYKAIRALIQSKRTVNQNDLHKWAIRIHDDSNLGQMHVLYMLREMLADLGIEVVSETTAEKKG